MRLPPSIKTAAARLAKADGVSLNQFIAVAVAEKVGVMETAGKLLGQRAGDAKPKDLLRYLRKAGPERPAESDRRWQLDEIRTGIKQLDEGGVFRTGT